MSRQHSAGSLSSKLPKMNLALVALMLLPAQRARAFSPFNKVPSQIIKPSQLASSEIDTETSVFTLTVALTREEGKNDKLQRALSTHPTASILKNTMRLKTKELPCIETRIGPDLEAFGNLLSEESSLSDFDYVVITSPESAKVFSDTMSKAGNPSPVPPIAAVGKATKKALTNAGYDVSFVPSKATGEVLAEELPIFDKVKLHRVLYPASAKAADTIQKMLEARKDASFVVTRLNTYDTVSVEFSDDDMESIMDNVQIACFGSPTSVNSWLENVDRFLGIEDLSDEDKKKTPGCNGDVIAVCIGTTTAKRCLESGRWIANNIYYPKTNPGVEGWADSCYTASGDVMERDFWGGGW